LAAGPFAEREKFDPKIAAKKAIDAARAKDGKQEGAGRPRRGAQEDGPAHAQEITLAKAPWEVDGRKWHTRDRVARNGRPVRWDGRILELIADRVGREKGKVFSPTDWSERGVVRIFPKDRENHGSFPFFHATTSGEWVVTLRFFVPRATFRTGAVESLLELAPFHESPTPVLSDAPRVRLRNVASFQEITITGHALTEFESPGFDAFLSRAVTAFRNQGKSRKLKRASEL
jgi:excinuclease ABC subunit A